MPFEFLIDHVAAADIVITSTGADRGRSLTREQFNHIHKARRMRPIFIIDIAVPRDVEASVGELESVYLYNLDDLQQVVSGTQSQRTGAVDGAQAIVKQHVDEFLVWNRSRAAQGPIIDQLFKRYHAIAQEEVVRTVNKLPNLSPAEREQIDDLVRRVVNKLLHDLIRTLKESEPPHVARTAVSARADEAFSICRIRPRRCVEIREVSSKTRSTKHRDTKNTERCAFLCVFVSLWLGVET